MELTTGNGEFKTIDSQPTAAAAAPSLREDEPRTAPTEKTARSKQEDVSVKTAIDGSQPQPSQTTPRRRSWRKWFIVAVAGGVLAFLAYRYLYPKLVLTLKTVSTDDAYVNGHVTFVAPRVSGQVAKVLVDDNYRVKKGDLLVQLDKEPFEVQVAINQAAVTAAQAGLVAAQAQVRGMEALAGSQRWQLQSAMEQVAGQIATLHADIATYQSKKAELALAVEKFRRAEALLPRGAISKEEFQVRSQTVKVEEQAVNQALEQVYARRAALGLPPKVSEEQLAEVPPDLTQSFSGVRTALSSLVQTAAELGVSLPHAGTTPEQFLAAFPNDRDKIRNELVRTAPAVKQAEAKLLQAQRDLDQAKLNLHYCDVVSEIDGVVTSRNVNPGNNVQVGENLMAVRSLTEIWIDANFKETQLARLRIGQRVVCDVDMYGSENEFEGRITGFTMGTGQTLSLLPPQNATGNFVKIVQRLPVRVELTKFDPDKLPLFVGLSVEPHVYYKEPPTGPDAGEYLQPYSKLPQKPAEPRP